MAFGIGSFIAVSERFGSGVTLYKVIGETETQWKTEGSMRFRKSDLLIIGSSGDRWAAKNGREATDDDLISCRIRAAQNALKSLKITKSNLKQVESLLGIG